MTHHDGISDDNHGDAVTPNHDEPQSTSEDPGEAADFVHAVDHGAGTEEELSDGTDKGDFTTSTDHGDGPDAPPNALREDGYYVSGSADNSGPDGNDYVDPVDHGQPA